MFCGYRGGELECLTHVEFVKDEVPLDSSSLVFLAHAAVVAKERADLAVDTAFKSAGRAGASGGQVGEEHVTVHDEADQEPRFAKPVVGESELSVDEHGALSSEVPEGAPPLVEAHSPLDRVIDVGDVR